MVGAAAEGLDSAALIDFDQRHIWHPYSPSPNPVDPVLVTGNEGIWLELADGRRVIDGMSSWWAAAFGHRHPRLVAAAHSQIDRMSHVMFGGLTHAPAVEAASKLLRLAGEPYSKVFFADSGSVAVEVALKMAFQYQRGIGRPGRTRVLTWRRGYHGDTFATMSLCDPDGGMHSMWSGNVTSHVFAPVPPERGASQQALEAYLADFESLVDPSIAAVVVEPIVQGAGGMRFHDAALLRGLRRICDEHGLLLVADEIATGFGRTGEVFATTGAGVIADIMCVGKALTGGMMTLAATLTTDAVAAAISSPAGGGALMHGPTFMANPLATAVAGAALDLVAEGQWRPAVARIESELRQGLAGLPRARVLGAIGVVELDRPVDMACATRVSLDHGVWLRPFGRLVYTMPPFICSTEDIATVCAAVRAVVESEET